MGRWSFHRWRFPMEPSRGLPMSRATRWVFGNQKRKWAPQIPNHSKSIVSEIAIFTNYREDRRRKLAESRAGLRVKCLDLISHAERGCFLNPCRPCFCRAQYHRATFHSLGLYRLALQLVFVLLVFVPGVSIHGQDKSRPRHPSDRKSTRLNSSHSSPSRMPSSA